MRPEALRNSVILGLTFLGFAMWTYTSGNPMVIAYAWWTLAAVYALLTSPRRFL